MKKLLKRIKVDSTSNPPIIKITAKCRDKDLYYPLLKHYNKIEDVIKYVQKVVVRLPYERKLKIDFVQLKKDIKTVDFIPKNIGFSFDFQNTIDTFIGTNIYENQFVAIAYFNAFGFYRGSISNAENNQKC